MYDEKVKIVGNLKVGKDCEQILNIGLWPSIEIFFCGLAISMIVASFSYVFVEKPAIDARRVFKTKW